MPKWTSTQIRKQEVHSNGPVLDDVLLADPEVSTFYILINLFLLFMLSSILLLKNAHRSY